MRKSAEVRRQALSSALAFSALLASGCDQKGRQTGPETDSGVRITGIEPSVLNRYGLQPLRIHGVGTEFEMGGATVLLARGADTLRFASPEIFDDTSLGIPFDMADSGMSGTWDVIAETGSRRLVFSQGLRVEKPDPWMTFLSRNALGMDQEGEIAIQASGSSFDLGPVSIWLRHDSDSLAAEVEALSAGGVLARFRVPKYARAGYWDLHLSQPWYRISKPSAVLMLMSATPIGPDASILSSPDTLSSLSDQTLRIHYSGMDLGVYRLNPQGVEFRFSGGTDIPIHRAEVLDDSTVELDVRPKEGSGRGYRDLNVIVNNVSHPFPKAVFLDLPVPAIVSAASADFFPGRDAKVVLTTSNTRLTREPREFRLTNNGFTISAQTSIVVSDTEAEIFFRIPADAAAGFWAVQMIRPGYSMTSSRTFEIKGPPPAYAGKVASIQPASARRGEKLSFTITGQDVEFLQGTRAHVKVSLVKGDKAIYRGDAESGVDGIEGTVTVDMARTMFRDNPLADSLPLGAYDVHASYWRFPTSQTQGQWVDLEPLQNGFVAEDYLRGGPPRIVSVTPDTVYEGETPLIFTILGENTAFTDSARFEYAGIRGGFRTVPISVVGSPTDESITLTINEHVGYTSSGSFAYHQFVFPQNGGLVDLKIRNPFVIERGILQPASPKRPAKDGALRGRKQRKTGNLE